MNTRKELEQFMKKAIELNDQIILAFKANQNSTDILQSVIKEILTRLEMLNQRLIKLEGDGK